MLLSSVTVGKQRLISSSTVSPTSLRVRFSGSLIGTQSMTSPALVASCFGARDGMTGACFLIAAAWWAKASSMATTSARRGRIEYAFSATLAAMLTWSSCPASVDKENKWLGIAWPQIQFVKLALAYSGIIMADWVAWCLSI